MNPQHRIIEATNYVVRKPFWAIRPSIHMSPISLPNPSGQLHQSSSWIFLQYSPLHVSGACSEAIDTAVVLRPQDGIGPED